MRKYICLFISLLILQSAFSQVIHTKINYVHGMKGSGKSLSRIQKHMDAWQKGELLNTTRFETPIQYTSKDGIPLAATELITILKGDPNYLTTKKRFIIAHSLGGLVSRKMHIDYKTANAGKTPYDGIITLCTPHLGAPVANRLNSATGRAEFDKQMKFIIDNITWGPRVDALGTIESVANNSTLTFLIKESSKYGANAMLNSLAQGLVEHIYGALINKLDAGDYIQNNIAGSEKILKHLSTDSPEINYIQTYDKNQTGKGTDFDTKTFKIAVAGVEEKPSIFRMMGASIEQDRLPDGPTLLTAGVDYALIEILQQIQTRFIIRAQELSREIKEETWGNKDRRYRIHALLASGYYIGVDFHTAMELLMGLRASKDGTATPNDGLVTKDSQLAYEGAYQIEMKEINHEEVKFSVETGELMKNIFYGNDPVMKSKSLSHWEFYKIFK